MAGLSITGALGSVGSGCLVDLEGSPQLVASLGRIDVCYSALTPPLFLTPDFFQGFTELSSTLGPRPGPPKSVSMACWRGLTALALVGGNGSPPCPKSLTQQLISLIPAI